MITKGVRYMLIAVFFFGLMNISVKMVPNIPAIEIVFFRSLISLVLSFFVLKINKVKIFGIQKKFLLMRGAFGAFALILYFTTLQLMPLASAVTLQFLSPIFSSILGIYIVKEKIKPVQWVFYLMAFIGVVFVKGFDSRITPLLFTIGIVSAFFSGMAYNFIRKLKKSEHPLVIVFYFPLVTLPVTGLIVLFDWVKPEGIEWVILLLVGIFTQLAQYFMTKAYQIEELSKVASINYLGLIYALGLGYVFFDETFNLLSYVGMFIMILGVFFNLWYKHHIAKKNHDF